MSGKVGRPLKFETDEELRAVVDAYFTEAEEKGEPLTITGLAYALDTTRELLLNYETKAEFSHTIRRAKARIHRYAENYLYTGKNQVGAIFNLKNNWGWRDKTEQEISGPGAGPLLMVHRAQQIGQKPPETVPQLPASIDDPLALE